MSDLTDLALWWDATYNRVLLDGPPGYLVVSTLRILIALAAWHMVKALTRYVSAAFPPPHTASNAAYWLRWWLWLRLREFAALKVGAAALAVLLVLQIPAGAGGALGTLTVYFALAHPALWLLLVGLAHMLNRLTHRIEHPAGTD